MTQVSITGVNHRSTGTKGYKSRTRYVCIIRDSLLLECGCCFIMWWEVDLCHVTWHTPCHVMCHVMYHLIRHVMCHVMCHVICHVIIGHLSGEWGGHSINKGLHSNFYKALECEFLNTSCTLLSAGKPERKKRVGLKEKKDK